MIAPLYIAYDPVYCHPLPEGHRFPMQKYELIPEQLLFEGFIGNEQLHRPAVCPDDIVCLTHTPGYLAKLKSKPSAPKSSGSSGFRNRPA